MNDHDRKKLEMLETGTELVSELKKMTSQDLALDMQKETGEDLAVCQFYLDSTSCYKDAISLYRRNS